MNALWFTLLTTAFLTVGSPKAFGLVRLGVDGGVSLATLSYGTSTGVAVTSPYGTRTGLMAGGILEWGFNDYVSLQLEGNYIQKGATVPNVSNGVTLITSQYDYFEVPLFLKFTADLPLIKPFIAAGPYLAFSVNAQTSNSSTGLSTPLTNYSSTDFGVSGMVGAEFALTPVISFLVDLRYDLGFTDLDSTAITTIRSRSFIIAGGLLIGI